MITELPRTGEVDSWRAQTKPCTHHDPGERSSEPIRDFRVSVQESLAEAWVGGGLLQAGGTECSRASMGPLEGGCPYLHHLHHSSVSGQTTGREHSPSTENWIKDLLSMALPIRTRPDSPSVSLSHKPLILPRQRADRMKTKNRKLIKLTTWTTALSNSV